MDKELQGVELLYYLITRFNMSYNDAIRDIVKNKKDMSFLDEIVIQDTLK